MRTFQTNSRIAFEATCENAWCHVPQITFPYRTFPSVRAKSVTLFSHEVNQFKKFFLCKQAHLLSAHLRQWRPHFREGGKRREEDVKDRRNGVLDEHTREEKRDMEEEKGGWREERGSGACGGMEKVRRKVASRFKERDAPATCQSLDWNRNTIFVLVLGKNNKIVIFMFLRIFFTKQHQYNFESKFHYTSVNQSQRQVISNTGLKTSCSRAQLRSLRTYGLVICINEPIK